MIEDEDIKFEIEEIKYQADMIAGLSQVFELYLANNSADESLINSLKCLSISADEHSDACTALMNKVFEK